ncbi:MAG: hypothetical protein PHS14_04860 [Elusimicrobia bacterium]|nr:hypothetical protein [Elusimicrobiota bacterium]
MRLARYADGAYLVPGTELLWLDVEGHGTVGVRSREAYLHADGTLEPGVLESPVRTELHCYRFPDEPVRFGPLVCRACGDSGNSQRHTWGPCEACNGYAEEKNLHVCALCGEVSEEVLPCAPRETLNHELLLRHAHATCAVEAEVARIRSEEPSLVGLGIW